MSHSINVIAIRATVWFAALGLFFSACTPCAMGCAAVRLVDSQSGRPVNDAVIDFPGQGGARSFVASNLQGIYDIPVCTRSLPLEITSPTHRTKTTTYVPMPPGEACTVQRELVTILLDPS